MTIRRSLCNRRKGTVAERQNKFTDMMKLALRSGSQIVIAA